MDTALRWNRALGGEELDLELDLGDLRDAQLLLPLPGDISTIVRAARGGEMLTAAAEDILDNFFGQTYMPGEDEKQNQVTRIASKS